jgi:integrase
MATMELFRGEGRRTWQLRFTDNRGYRRQISTREQSRGTAMVISTKIELIIDRRIRGDAVPADLVQWLSATHKDIRKKLVEWEIADVRTAEGGKPLFNLSRPDPLPADWRDPPPALVDLWEQDLTDREVTRVYAVQSAQRVRVLLALPVGDHRPIQYLADVTAEGIMARVRELRRVGPPPSNGRKRKVASPQTCEHYLGKAREFFAWLVSKGYAYANPAAGLTAYSDQVIQANRQRARRALTLEEQITLVTGTAALPRRWNMDGAERALLYRLVLRTGLRAYEARTLRVASFNFFTKQMTVMARDAKASREDVLPIADELIPLLRTHFTGKLPQAAAFSPLSEFSFCEMLREDLTALHIPYQDQLGRFADFHALRHTYGTDLAKLVMPAIHQRLMRHASIVTTMKFYTHLDEQDKAAAVAKLPAFPEAPPPVQNNLAG